ncbi:MAG: hypothetical protein KKD01_12845 [Proteobacteria bacterium]|nr:hypothetical protein [Pseudomonadota bacterium]MBU1232524.1 hypothetical protein [Pseudomonadota bacterium]MBU1420277.1 hypothetical protein [Pseudomonadota bacterium]MBU1455606.1 hypothetical protein [Pseudomonadota bacterium]
MFLRMLARDLYRSQKEVESLEQQLLEADTVAEQEKVKDLLRQAKVELEQIRKVMEGRKEQSRSLMHKPKSRF